jgi:hypothetical protein
LPLAVLAQEPRQIVIEVQNRSRTQSQRYEGTLQVINEKSRIAEKRWLYERAGAYGDSKSVLRFTAPAEVKGVALLVHNHKDRSSDQWMWTPALQRDRRVALQDRSTRFFGTDFSFEDLEERDAYQFEYKILGEEPIGAHQCWKLESRPVKSKTSQYTHSHVWVRKDIYVIPQIDAYKGDTLVRRIRYKDFENIRKVWTARVVEVEAPKDKSKTVLRLDRLEYDAPMKDEDFTLQSLRR